MLETAFFNITNHIKILRDERVRLMFRRWRRHVVGLQRYQVIMRAGCMALVMVGRARIRRVYCQVCHDGDYTARMHCHPVPHAHALTCNHTTYILPVAGALANTYSGPSQKRSNPDQMFGFPGPVAGPRQHHLVAPGCRDRSPQVPNISQRTCSHMYKCTHSHVRALRTGICVSAGWPTT